MKINNQTLRLLNKKMSETEFQQFKEWLFQQQVKHYKRNDLIVMKNKCSSGSNEMLKILKNWTLYSLNKNY